MMYNSNTIKGHCHFCEWDQLNYSWWSYTFNTKQIKAQNGYVTLIAAKIILFEDHCKVFLAHNFCPKLIEVIL